MNKKNNSYYSWKKMRMNKDDGPIKISIMETRNKGRNAKKIKLKKNLTSILIIRHLWKQNK